MNVQIKVHDQMCKKLWFIQEMRAVFMSLIPPLSPFTRLEKLPTKEGFE